VKLNHAAGEILKRCDGEASVATIIDDLKSAFPEIDRRRLRALLQERLTSGRQ
ncbi:MAG: hypothetical protein DBP01_15510, partial [gamma proteobacterium symbiont of Ctena orbiculata]